MASPSDQQCLISLGANLGDRLQTLQAAIARLREHAAVRDFQVSSFYETAPIGGPAGQQSFINAAARFTTSLAPLELMRVLQQIESDLGRTRGERWAERTLDLDLLLYSEEIIDTPELRVPHDRMIYRRFVLEPAAEIAAHMKHASSGLSLSELLARLDVRPTYIAVAGPPGGIASQIVQSVANQFGEAIVQIIDPVSADSRKAFDVEKARQWRNDRANELLLIMENLPQGHGHVIASDFWVGQLQIGQGPVPEWKYFDSLDENDLKNIGRRAISPTLLVWLQPSANASDTRNSGWRIGPSVPFTPTIVVSEADPQWAVDEVTAAIAAINDRPRRLPALDSEPPPAGKS